MRTPDEIFAVPTCTSELLGRAEDARLLFADIAVDASQCFPVLFRNLVKTGQAMGMNAAQARISARRVTKQMAHVANLASESAKAMNQYAINYKTGYLLETDKARTGFNVKG